MGPSQITPEVFPRIRLGLLGTAAAPSLSFLASPGLGWFRSGVNQMGLAVNGVLSGYFSYGGDANSIRMVGGAGGLVAVDSSAGVRLEAGGTNQPITLVPSGTGLVRASVQNGQGFAIAVSGTDVGYLTGDGTATALIAPNSRVLDFYSGTVNPANRVMRMLNTGTVLFGTTTDSANGRLQLATHTTSAGGIGFGTTVALYQTAAGRFAFDHVGGTSPEMDFRENGTAAFTLTATAASVFLRARTGSLVLRSADVAALTLDSSQNATFAKNVSAGGLITNNPDLGASDQIVAQFENANAAGGSSLVIRRGLGATGGGRAAQVNFNGQWFAGILRNGGNNTDVFSIGAGSDRNTIPAHLMLSGSGASGVVNVLPTTASTSTTTGALTVAGGVGVAGAANFGAELTIGAADVRLSRSSAAVLDLRSAASPGVTARLDINGSTSATLGLRQTGNRDWFISAESNELQANCLTAGSIFAFTSNVEVAVRRTTASTSTTTGALTVAGGIGVAGALNVGGAFSALSSSESLFANNGNQQLGIRIRNVTDGSNSAAYTVWQSDAGALNFYQTATSSNISSNPTRYPAATSLFDSTSTGGFQWNANGTRAMRLASGGNLTTEGTVTTAAPTGGAGAWKLGVANSVSPTSPNRTITIEIGGTTYYLAAKTTND